jgi:DNA invertase Pin-like site-specific DNA recombinase
MTERLTRASSILIAVRPASIEKGTVLLIESFDRLSRESVLPAVRRLVELIEAGVTVITLADRQEYSEERLQNDWTPLLISITIMSRAHEESRLKSEGVGKAWWQSEQL